MMKKTSRLRRTAVHLTHAGVERMTPSNRDGAQTLDVLAKSRPQGSGGRVGDSSA